jgi:hypothetical protein
MSQRPNLASTQGYIKYESMRIKVHKNLNLFNYVRSNVFDTQGLNARVATAFAETKDGKVF